MSKSFFFLLLAVAGGLAKNRAKIDHWLNPPPPRVAGHNKVILYFTTWCGTCIKHANILQETKSATLT
ncbi:MAG: hypothetical protein ACRERV_01730 [Methylococcales bacterium]